MGCLCCRLVFLARWRNTIMKRATIGCACCCGALSRRSFLRTGCGAACAGAASLAMPTARLVAAPATDRTRIRIVYALHAPKQPGPDWPNLGFDFVPVMERIRATLAQGCPGFEFVTSTAAGVEEANKILEADRPAPVDGYLVYQMNCWNEVVQPVAATGKPVAKTGKKASRSATPKRGKRS